MDLYSRRITRSSTDSNNENSLVGKRTVKGNDPIIARRALVDQRNTRGVRTAKIELEGKELIKNVPAKPEPVQRSPIKHPELVGIEREFQTADYMDDIYNYLLSKEKDFFINDNGTNKATVTSKMRSILIDWLVQVHGRFHLFAETLHLSVYLVDVVLANMKVEKSELQLVGMACMLVASKFEEMYVPDIKDFEYIADNAFTKRQIMKMEIRVLQTAGYALSRPHSITFLRWLTKEADSTHRQHNLAKYFGEIALVDNSVAHFRPSQIALLSLFLANAISNKELPTAKLVKLINWSEDALTEAITLFSKAVLRVHSQEKLIAIRNKYASSKNSNVANLSDHDLEILRRL